MKRFVALLLLIVTVISLASCNSGKREITCEDIINAYEAKGYYVVHTDHHKDDSYYCLCTISVREREMDYDSDHIYFVVYRTAKEAKADAKVTKYNLAKWFFALAFGESRWLKSKHYENIAYSYYNAKLAKPFKKLTK